MSNLIKGFSTGVPGTNETYVIDNEKSDIGMELNERIKNMYSNSSSGFSAGIDMGELSPDEYGNLINPSEDAIPDTFVENEELAHEAALVIEEANAEAEEIIKQARAEAEDIKELAKSQGQEEGYQEGMANANAELDAIKAQLEQEKNDFIANANQQLEQSLVELEPQFNDVLCNLLERLTGVVVSGHKEVILYLIDNAMRGIENSHDFVISLSDEDYPYVDKNKEKIYGYLNPSTKIELFQDSNLSKNQCKIETENGLTDLSLDVQLNELVKSLMLLNS